jgi:hypothetical protein
MNRFAYGVAVCVTSVGTLWAQQPDGVTPPPTPSPPPAAATVEPAADAGRAAKPRANGTERGRRREAGQGQQVVPGAFMERLRLERPELHKRLSKLYEDDRELFFQEVRELMRERGAQAAEEGGPSKRQAGDGTSSTKRAPHDSVEEQKCAELGRLYRESKDAAAKERLKGELAAAIQVAFQARLRTSQERIARLEQQVKEFRERLERMEANREKICAERLDELTTPAELRWDRNW